MKNNIWISGVTMRQLFLFIFFITGSTLGPMDAAAGSPAYEEAPVVKTSAQQKVEVTLRGADRRGIIQIIDYILGRLPGVVGKKAGELHIVPYNANQCQASWQLTVQGANGLDIESELLTTINSLDLTSHNDIFYEAPFIIIAQDLETVKQIKGRKASEDDIIFSLLEEDFEPFAVANQNFIPPSGNPWLSVPGAGFE